MPSPLVHRLAPLCLPVTLLIAADGDVGRPADRRGPSINDRAPSCQLQQPGPVSWWPADGDAADAADGNTGTLVGVGFAAGRVRQAFRFDGDGDRVQLGNPANLRVSAGEFTVEAWVNFAPAAVNADAVIFSKMGDAPVANGDGWMLLKQRDNRFWLCFGGGSVNGCTPDAATTVASGTLAASGTWYHVAGVKSGSEIAIWVNGISEHAKPLPRFSDSNGFPAVIGDPRPRHQMLGLIDELAIHNRALPACDIQALFTAGSAGRSRMWR